MVKYGIIVSIVGKAVQLFRKNNTKKDLSFQVLDKGGYSNSIRKWKNKT